MTDLEIVKLHSFDIQYIENPSIEVQHAAVKRLCNYN